VNPEQQKNRRSNELRRFLPIQKSDPPKAEKRRLDCFVACAPLRKRFAFVATAEARALMPQ
jgi:hypothetical protein